MALILPVKESVSINNREPEIINDCLLQQQRVFCFQSGKLRYRFVNP